MLKNAHLKCRFGELAQMVERSLSMREVGGSMPPFSKRCFAGFYCQHYHLYVQGHTAILCHNIQHHMSSLGMTGKCFSQT